jgi:hypothetical protein
LNSEFLEGDELGVSCCLVQFSSSLIVLAHFSWAVDKRQESSSADYLIHFVTTLIA